MDLNYLVSQIKGDIIAPTLRVRQGKVITVNANRTIDVQIAGDTNTLPSVRYLSNYAPKPDDQTWLINSGADLLAIGMVASATRTLACTAYRTSTLDIVKDTLTSIPFQEARRNDWNCWTVADATKLTAPITGVYQATAAILIESENARVEVSIYKGTQEIARQDVDLTKTDVGGFHGMVTSVPFEMTKGDFITMRIQHDYNPDLTLLLSAGGKDHTGYFNALSLTYLGS
jgi:hypothetical protein